LWNKFQVDILVNLNIHHEEKVKARTQEKNKENPQEGQCFAYKKTRRV
jgi:hypothetical protein